MSDDIGMSNNEDPRADFVEPSTADITTASLLASAKLAYAVGDFARAREIARCFCPQIATSTNWSDPLLPRLYTIGAWSSLALGHIAEEIGRAHG